MEAVTISKSRWFTRPWHVQLAGAYGLYTGGATGLERDLSDGDVSVCSYFWHCVLGVLIAVLCTAFAVSVISFPVGDFAAWLAAGLVHTFVDPGEAAGILIAVVIALVGVVVALIVFGFAMIGIDKLKKGEVGIASAMYNAVATKTCIPVKYKQ